MMGELVCLLLKRGRLSKMTWRDQSHLSSQTWVKAQWLLHSGQYVWSCTIQTKMVRRRPTELEMEREKVVVYNSPTFLPWVSASPPATSPMHVDTTAAVITVSMQSWRRQTRFVDPDIFDRPDAERMVELVIESPPTNYDNILGVRVQSSSIARAFAFWV